MALDLSGGVAETLPGAQIIVWCDAPKGRVAGVELWRRAVYTACRAGFQRLIIVAPGRVEEVRSSLADDPRLEGRRWEVVTPGESWAARVVAAGGRWVLLQDRWVVDATHLRDLAATTRGRAASSPEGPIVADATDVVEIAGQVWSLTHAAPSLDRVLESPLLYVEIKLPPDLRRAEDALFQGLARNVTNFFARTIDRPMSRAISRVLAPWPITPNQITIFSIGLGIVGALCLLRPTYSFGLLGSFLFLLSTIVDGCDGEIARLKFQESARGAQLDVIGDNVVHAFLFPCVALHAYFADPNGPYLLLGASAIAGVIATWAAIYFIVVRGNPGPRVDAFFEAFGNRLESGLW